MGRLFHLRDGPKRAVVRRVAGAVGTCHRCRGMETLELLIGLLAAVAVVVRLAGRTAIPEPVLLVLAGLAVALIPGLPEVELDPELTLALFLPPLLYWAALHTDLRDLRANLRPIALLAVGLVLVTTAAVAALAHSVLGLPWAVAVVLGAIVSPPDPVAAVAVAGRLGLPRRMVTILEGEGLLDDATALVVYRMAVAAAVSGTFSIGEAAVELAVSAVGGTAVGLVVGWAGSRILRRVSEAPVENTVKLLLPYVAWLAAERAHASGVLAVLACGVVMARHWGAISSGARLQARQLWDWLVFVLEGLSFVLIGVQLRTVVEGIEGRSLADLALTALAVNLVVVAVRLAVVYPASWLPRLSARLRERDPFPGWPVVTVIGWAGMRGVVTLALALAIPTTVEGGGPFPDRNLVVFLSFSVIVVTLVGQGLTLPWVIRRLGVGTDGDGAAGDGRRVLARLSQVALDHLDALDPEADGVPAEVVERLRERYRARLAHLDAHGDEGPPDGDRAYTELVRELLGAQREELRHLREEGGVTPEVARRLFHDLDVEEARLERERPG
jgi:monovalent cation/hydrogen antiporter